MILVGIDDTDIAGSRGTNQLAKAVVRELPAGWRCLRIVRHQLLDDPRVPYTSKNGSASIALVHNGEERPDRLLDVFRRVMRDEFIEGSDPGLCAATDVPPDVVEFGARCKTQLVTQDEARRIAAAAEIPLEGLGGTNGGVIGALAAVGLAATENDGRIVQLGTRPDDLTGVHSVETIRELDVDVRDAATHTNITQGRVDIGKKLRPNLRNGRATLFVQPDAAGAADFAALKLP
ncbi:MAG: ABC transporter substrate-binding protein [Planctomycetaceae bacterium]